MPDAHTDEYDDWTEKDNGGEQKPPTVTEEIADEATRERPEGLPSLMPFAVLYSNRRKRAEFFRCALSPAVQELQEAGGEELTSSIPAAMQAMADMEDALRMVVHPASKQVLDKWLRDVDDETLMQAFSWYMGQMGEATASST